MAIFSFTVDPLGGKGGVCSNERHSHVSTRLGEEVRGSLEGSNFFCVLALTKEIGLRRINPWVILEAVNGDFDVRQGASEKAIAEEAAL